MTQQPKPSLRLYAATARYLKVSQLFWRIGYRLIWWPSTAWLTRKMPAATRADIRQWTTPIRKPQSHYPDNSFEFLNRKVSFDNSIDWEHSAHGRLWTYNLHYFDYLNGAPHVAGAEQHNTAATGHALIDDWIAHNAPKKGTGWEPYPTSLRIVNWIKWTLSGQDLHPAAINSLYAQTRWLSHRIEHHILANHLFTNLKALCFGGFFFDGTEASAWRRKALKLLKRELQEQFLADGAHFELSPMYHDIMLEDMLDLINLFASQPDTDYAEIKTALATTAGRLLQWSRTARHPDQQIAFFNDAAFAIAPSIEALSAYAARLSIEPARKDQQQNAEQHDKTESITVLADSGLVVLRQHKGFAIFDSGPIGLDYQPGHAHADSLSFEYSWGSERIFVNSGTSTYAADELRHAQRSTRLHNTVEVDNRNSSEVWSAFRVAARASAQLLESGQTDDEGLPYAAAKHDGYSAGPHHVVHTRKLCLGQNSLRIEDSLSGKWDSAIARFYLHPSITPNDSQQQLTSASGQVFKLQATGGFLTISAAKWYPEFGAEQASHCLEFTFSDSHNGPFVFQMTALID